MKGNKESIAFPTASMSSTKRFALWSVPSPWADYLELTKPRLLFMVLLSTMVGFYLGTSGLVRYSLTLATLFGTMLVGGGSMVLNQFLERDSDAKMVRTQNRPIPQGRLHPNEALAFGVAMSIGGFLLFVFFVNWASTFFAFTTWATYLFVYTPLKKKTSLSTIAGAFPGAFPVLIGWAAARGSVSFEPALLFFIVFFWQLPHFLAIAWMYRADFVRAGFPMLSVFEGSGSLVARQMILNICALIPVSLLPTIFGLTGTIYFFGAFSLGLLFAAVVIFAASNLDGRARYVLRASIVYLAILLILMIVDKV